MWLFGNKKETSDEELVQRYYDSGQKTHVGQLFEKHVKTVYGVCLYYMKDREVAQDLVMQIFEKLMTELRKTKVKNFKAWLSFVVRNQCLNELNKKSQRRFVPESYLDFEYKQPDLEEEEKLAGVTEDQLLQYLSDALPLLKEKQKQCVQLFYLEGKSYDDICIVTGYDLKEVKSYIQNGKRNLKLIIEAKQKGNEAA